MEITMEKTKRSLKCCSWVAIVVGVISALRLVLACFFGDDMIRATVEQAIKEMNESMELMSAMVTVAYVIIGVTAAVTLLLNLYIGIRGIGVANGTYKGKAFVVWLVVMIAFDVFDIVSTVGTGGEAAAVIGSVIPSIVLVCNLIEMFICTRKIRSAG